MRQFVTSGTSGQKVSDDGQFRRLFIGAITGLEPEANPNRDPYVTGNELGNFLQQKVTNLSAGRQTPLFGPMNEQGYDQGDFVFQVREEAEAAAAATAAPGQVKPLEQRFWTFVSARRDAKLIEDYLRAFPETPFRTIAVAELGALRGGSRPAAAGTPRPGDFDVVTVFYATDRKPLGAGGDYGSERGRALAWGEAKITVPRTHMGAQIERPWTIQMPYMSVGLSDQKEDPKQHFTLQSIKTDDAQLSKIKTSLQGEGPKKDALVYIHGYNTTFKDALFRAAQIAYDLKFDGPVFVYSWPSGAGRSPATPTIGSRRVLAQPYFRKFLETITQQTGIGTIHLVAHSMGNQLLADVLADIGNAADAKAFRIGQVIFAAPDVDPRPLRGTVRADSRKLSRAGRSMQRPTTGRCWRRANLWVAACRRRWGRRRSAEPRLCGHDRYHAARHGTFVPFAGFLLNDMSRLSRRERGRLTSARRS